MNLLVTGGTGYIGRRVAELARERGWQVTLLGSGRRAGGTRAIPWRLGEPVPAAAWHAPVDAVIHLAHCWQNTGAEASDVNVAGSELLFAAARKAGVTRMVFASSISARPDALNRYGRTKRRIEELLHQGSESAARIGLVYGGSRRSQWGMLYRLTGRFPVLPMIGTGQLVQPIHLDDVAAGLLRLAAMPAPVPPIVVLAGEPIPFGEFLRRIARAIHGRRLLLLPLPSRPVLLLLDALVRLGLPVDAIRERVRGLVGITVRPGAADAAMLGMSWRSLEQGLDAERPSPLRWRIAEGAALLAYVRGRAPTPATLRRYVRGSLRFAAPIGAHNGPVLPPVLRRFPPLLWFAEPPAGDNRPKAAALRARLRAAAVLAETEPGAVRQFCADEPAGRSLAVSRLALYAVIESLLLVPRHLIGWPLWR